MPQGLLPFSNEGPHLRFYSNRDRGALGRLRTKLYHCFCVDRRRTRNIGVTLVSFVLLFYILYLYLWKSNVVIDEEVLLAVPKAVLEKRLDFKSKTIDKMCSTDFPSTCYTIMDKNLPEIGVAERHFIVDGTNDESDTIVMLKPPKGESFDTSDTRIWTVDHLNIRSQYVAGLLVSPFLVSSLSIEGENKNKSILEIGLGGGSLAMALGEMKPQLNITTVEIDSVVIQLAEKWFGMTSSTKRRTIHQDGLDYLEGMVERGEKVDVLIVDACDSSKILPCPAAAFRESRNIQMMKEAIKEQGSVVVNILWHEGDDLLDNSEVVKQFLEVFPSCLQLKMVQEVNVVLVCVPYSIADTESQLEFYSNRLKSAVSKLSLEYILSDITVSSSAVVV